MTREVYEQSMRDLNIPGPPPGSLLHASGPIKGGWRIVEVWESEAAAATFYGSAPFQKMAEGIGIQPNIIASYLAETVRK